MRLVRFALLLALASCIRPARAPSELPEATLLGLSNESAGSRELGSRAPLTLFFFFSAHCPCMSAHDSRMRALYDRFHARVQFVAVDSEVGASPPADEEQAKGRRYPFAIWVDRDASLARALGAEYATYSVLVDEHGHVRYAGGFDSDRTHLRPDATPYLSNAIEDLLAGREPRIARGKTLGCALQTW